MHTGWKCVERALRAVRACFDVRTQSAPLLRAPGDNPESADTGTIALTGSFFRFRHRLHALLHFLQRDVLFVSSHPPEMPEGVF